MNFACQNTLIDIFLLLIIIINLNLMPIKMFLVSHFIALIEYTLNGKVYWYQNDIWQSENLILFMSFFSLNKKVTRGHVTKQHFNTLVMDWGFKFIGTFFSVADCEVDISVWSSKWWHTYYKLSIIINSPSFLLTLVDQVHVVRGLLWLAAVSSIELMVYFDQSCIQISKNFPPFMFDLK